MTPKELLEACKDPEYRAWLHEQIEAKTLPSEVVVAMLEHAFGGLPVHSNEIHQEPT